MNILRNKNIADVPGILSAGISCGIKTDKKKDLCIIYSQYPAVSAAVFTRNKVKGAPLIVNMENIKNSNTQAIVINSGNANSCTGNLGIDNAEKMIEITAGCLNLFPQEVLVASTGALSSQLPMEKIIPGIKKACSFLSNDDGSSAAEAILSTDTCTKTLAINFQLDGKKITMAGMAKGSTMIHPNMGTMLAFIVTDADISKELLQKALKKSVDASFNMISVDGDTSTNDMAIVLANGAAGTAAITIEDENYLSFGNALAVLCTELAKMIAKDGEGSTKFIEVAAANAKKPEDAIAAARSIASSNLIKCEIFGGVIKWSTIACVLGYSDIYMDPCDYDIFISNDKSKVQLVKSSKEADYNEAELKKIMSGDFVKICIDLKIGEYSATAWGCDLSCKYVRANAYLDLDY
jgi:glutamate N-acetyltransferase / amino-acid N-acetyltransferase